MSDEESPCEQDLFERELILDELKRTLQFAATDEQQFRSRTTDLNSHQRKFNKIQTKIEKTLFKLKVFNKEEQIKIRNDFNDLYYAIITHLNKIKKGDEEQRRMSRPSVSPTVQTHSSKNLPTLPLPSFHGDPTDWPSYFDLFRSLVHFNSAYTDAEKFRYLLLTVHKEPHNLIKSIPITDANYSVALDILVSRYENKRVIASKHLDRILDIEPCSDKSIHSIRQLLNIYQENIRALEIMQFPVDQWSFLLLSILLRKLPMNTRKHFERSLSTPSHIPDVNQLISFLEREISAEEIINSTNGQSSKNVGIRKNHISNNSTPVQRSFRSFAAKVASSLSAPDKNRPYDNNVTKTKVLCVCCDGPHSLIKCTSFLNLTAQERYSLIRNKNICYNCLNLGHDVNQCTSNFVCRTCHKRHHSLIHFSTQVSPVPVTPRLPGHGAVSLPLSAEGRADVGSDDSQRVAADIGGCDNAIHNCYASNSPVSRSTTVLLSTALVDVYVGASKLSTVRCLVDTGSQASFITEACAQRLGMTRRHINIPVYGIGETEAVRPKGLVSLIVAPKGKRQPSVSVDALILKRLITHMPSVPLSYTEWSHLKDLKLADPNFHTPHPVDMLLGADVLSQVLLGGTVTGSPGSPMAINSIFGYLLLGKLDIDRPAPNPLQVCYSSFGDDDLERFWELESFPEKRSYTAAEKLCESFFEKTHTRDENGRYVLALPFRPDAPLLGESRQTALARFRKLEYRLERNPKLKSDYHACLQDYLDSNHMELVDSKPIAGSHYYIPHHCVVKDSSETTRTRVVYDAGCKTSNGYSLNDILLTGPKLHLDIVDVILKFRVHAIAFTADIKQMFRNILVRKEDREFQRILWRKSTEDPIQDYRLRTVTFGMSSSPYLALRTIRQLAIDEAEQFKLAAPVLLNDVFVDDVISGDSTVGRALELQQQLIDICRAAGFELRKWHSNSPALLSAVLTSECHGERPTVVPFAEMEKDAKVKVLGLQWNPEADSFNFKVQVSSNKCTKRAILSEIAKIYDPLGFLSPVTLYAKYLIQLLWMAKVEWDEVPPVDIINSWTSFTNELTFLSEVSFPRYIFPRSESIQLHGFSDASERAYAACVYFRHAASDGCVRTFLIMAKTRVAPLRMRLTIPRLELMGAQLLSKLIERVLQIYSDHISLENVYAWCDASIVLAWLHSPPHEWKTFISNRTSDILCRVPASRWRHVPSGDNPADAASRGMLPAAFVRNTLWFNGPAWLRQDRESWPEHKAEFSTDEERRNKNIQSYVTSSVGDIDIISRFSSLGKLVRVTSIIFRFYNRCKGVTEHNSNYVTVPEYNFALKRLIYLVQQHSFKEDIKNISLGKLSSNQLRRLTPFLDDNNFLRVGGRIHKSLLSYDSKHQLILPKKHHLTNLIIDHAHISHLHAGPQSVQYLLLQQYWILSSRDIVRQRIHRCVSCFRARPIRNQPRMGPLPVTRLRPARPFLKTAVDYAGPFYVRANKVRNAKVVKCYVSVFVCMSVKAIHLELVSELSTEAFLAALRRFTSRRGLCTDIFSDCGKNFIGCNNYLKELYAFLRTDTVQCELNQQTLQQGLTWHFQPPYASHFGGLFEAGVKSFKHHLHRVVGTRTQTYDEMHTLLCQIEAVLNSRPLCILSASSGDPLPLTPAHFLIGEPLTALPDVSLVDENTNRLAHWRWVQQAVQHFWKRWSKEYLHEIQQSQKWLQNRGSVLSEGTVVVVSDDNLPPLQWKLARVLALHPGSDNITRVVTLKIGNTTFKRPVVKLCPLPLE